MPIRSLNHVPRKRGMMHRAVEWLGRRAPGSLGRRLSVLAGRGAEVWRTEGTGSLLAKFFRFAWRRMRDRAASMRAIRFLGRLLDPARSREEKEVAIIEQDSDFDAEFFAGLDAWKYSRGDAIRMFVRHWRDSCLIRKPFPGFHPEIYASRFELLQGPTRPNPLVHYIQQGKPHGPWNERLIRANAGRIPSGGLKAALHVHAYYPEMLDEILQRAAINSAPHDLFITTTSAPNARAIESILASRTGLKAQVDIIPNQGRNISAFVHMLGRTQEYDVVGHVHTKKSLHMDARFADAWRQFLLANVLGDPFPMMDIALAEFAAQPKLGVVFPDDPHMTGWTENRDPARVVLQRLGVDMPLPDHFDFPNGAMFWVRPRALAPLIRAKLQWEEFPAEPVPYDGTLVHALERLIPLIAAHEGYYSAETVIPGVIR